MLETVEEIIKFKADEKGLIFETNIDRFVPDAIISDKKRLQ